MKFNTSDDKVLFCRIHNIEGLSQFKCSNCMFILSLNSCLHCVKCDRILCTNCCTLTCKCGSTNVLLNNQFYLDLRKIEIRCKYESDVFLLQHT